MAPRTARGSPQDLLKSLDWEGPTSEAGLPGPDLDPSHPLPRTRLTPTNSPLTPTNPVLPRTETRLFLDSRTKSLLLAQAKRWADRNLPTSEIRHRPPLLTAYVGFLVRERERLISAPRAVSEREARRRVRFARAVAPWSPRPHLYDGPPKVPRAELCLHRSLVAEFPKDGDDACRKKALQALQLGVVTGVHESELLEPSTISISEVGRLQFLKPADAIRFCEAAAAKGGGR